MLYLLTDHDQDLLDCDAYAVASDVVDDQFESLEQQWLSTIEVDTEKDMEGTVWADYDIYYLDADIENNNLIQ